jgi:mRNA-degrading endonuclease RelE of RelBE toxin-antitoxin system
MKLTFVESRPFTDRWHKRLGDEALRDLQTILLETPAAGDPMPGCGILRKLRFGDESRGKGKRGGVRVIYIHTAEASRIDLIAVYGKDEADDLTRDQIKELCGHARELRREVMERARRRPKGRKGRGT